MSGKSHLARGRRVEEEGKRKMPDIKTARSFFYDEGEKNILVLCVCVCVSGVCMNESVRVRQIEPFHRKIFGCLHFNQMTKQNKNITMLLH